MEDSWTPIVKEDVFFSEAASSDFGAFDALTNDGFYGGYGSDGISPCSSSSFLPSPEKSQSPVFVSLEGNRYPQNFDEPIIYEMAPMAVKEESLERDSSSSSRPHSQLSGQSFGMNADLDLDGLVSFGDYEILEISCCEYKMGSRFGRRSDEFPLPPGRTRSKMHDLAVKHRLITDQNPRSNGLIYLSAEEKRTLLQEGYELPTKLPLSREQEEALKIVRRKIKNKLSAQESRRKRKEYIDSLEKKVHCYYTDNIALRNRLKQIEISNRELMSQLKRLQTSVDHSVGPVSVVS